ncbi:MAG: hypothetical protein AAGH15_18490 [Myxococcota bacterium]
MEQRPTSVPGLVRQLVRQRWEKLGRVGQLGVIAAFFALLGGAFAVAATSMCGAGGCSLQRADAPCHYAPGASAEATDQPCPYSAREAAAPTAAAAPSDSPCGR